MLPTKKVPKTAPSRKSALDMPGFRLGGAYRLNTQTRDREPNVADLDALIDSVDARVGKLNAELSVILKRLGA